MRIRTLAAAVLTTALASTAWAADVVGFRMGYDSADPEATPPVQFTLTDKVRWRVDLPSWSNASPVVVGDLVCVLSEPASIHCLDAGDGTARWTDTVDALEGMPAEERATWEAKRTASRSARAALTDALTRYGALRRDLRRGDPDGSIAAELDTLSRKMAVWREEVREGRAVDTADDLEIIGYTTHSPTSDGQRIYALLGPGVAAAWSLDGKRLWTRWMGVPPPQARGYDKGWAASPVLADGLLIVPWGPLRALDPKTGAVRWTADVEYGDYGPPSVVTVGSTTVVLLPTGEMIRASDGTVLQRDVANVLYVGPVVVGDTLYTFGQVDGTQQVAFAESWTLSERAPGDVVATRRWRTPMGNGVRGYAHGTWTGSAYVAIDNHGEVHRFDPDTGAVTNLYSVTSGGYPGPVTSKDLVLLPGSDGTIVYARRDDPATIVHQARLEGFRSTPVLVGKRMYIRTHAGLWCLEAS